MAKLDGKIAVVTGASKGIGARLLQELLLHKSSSRRELSHEQVGSR